MQAGGGRGGFVENTLCIAQLACSCLGGTLVAGWQQYPGKTPNNFQGGVGVKGSLAKINIS